MMNGLLLMCSHEIKRCSVHCYTLSLFDFSKDDSLFLRKIAICNCCTVSFVHPMHMLMVGKVISFRADCAENKDLLKERITQKLK